MLDFDTNPFLSEYQVESYINETIKNFQNDNPIKINTANGNSTNKFSIPAEETLNNTLTDFFTILNENIVKLVYSNLITDEYTINLSAYNISNDNTHAKETTKGINNALAYARLHGYSKVILPPGKYLIDTDTIQEKKTFVDIVDNSKTWTSNLKGIIIPDNIDFDITNCILSLKPNVSPEQSLIVFANSDNSKLIGGTLIGDRDTHLFDITINKNGNELESGGFDNTTGLPVNDDTKMRTKNYISKLESGLSLPNSFVICPLANTSLNTVDGGCRYIYCYDNNNKFLGKTNDDDSFISRATLLPGTAKIKVSFKNEKRSDAKYYLSTESSSITFERSNGIVLYNSNNVTIENVTIKDFLTDGIGTMPFPINHSNNNINILNCTIENNRRQGISFVGSSDHILIKDCNIGKTQGTDPQSGIDIEHYSTVKNIIIDNCNFYDNKKWDIVNYNGINIEIKNCKFNGGVGSTYGYNMTIHNNEFEYYNNPVINKSYPMALILDTDQPIDSSVYFKVYENSFKNYNLSTGVSSSPLPNSTFKSNLITNCVVYPKSNSSSNKYYNSTIYMSKGFNYSNEYYENCTLFGVNSDNDSNLCTLTNIQLKNCKFKGNAIIKNSSVDYAVITH